jgi:peroxiredoxin
MRIALSLFLIPLSLLLAMGPDPSKGGDKGTISPLHADSVINTKAPDFSLKDVRGNDIALSSFKGKVVLLNFWATWCPPCKAEMPAMNKLYNEMKSRGFEVLAVTSDSSLSDVNDFLSRNKLDFRILFDEKKSVTRLYKVFSMPTTFLIGRDGTIVEKFYGEYDWTERDVRATIEKFL